MLTLPDALATLRDDELYQSIHDLRGHKMLHGRGRSPEAAYVREFCNAEVRRLQAEIRRRELPPLRPQANVWVRQAREATNV
jgi:hypothetical protein